MNIYRLWDNRNKITNPNNHQIKFFQLYDLLLSIYESKDLDNENNYILMENICSDSKSLLTDVEYSNLNNLIIKAKREKTIKSIKNILALVFGLNSWLVNSSSIRL